MLIKYNLLDNDLSQKLAALQKKKFELPEPIDDDEDLESANRSLIVEANENDIDSSEIGDHSKEKGLNLKMVGIGLVIALILMNGGSSNEN